MLPCFVFASGTLILLTHLQAATSEPGSESEERVILIQVCPALPNLLQCPVSAGLAAFCPIHTGGRSASSMYASAQHV